MKRNEKKKVEVLFKVAARHKSHSEKQPRRREGLVSMTTSEREAKRGRPALEPGIRRGGSDGPGASAAVV